MSVDAINAAQPQQKHNTGAAVGTGVVLGAAGAGAGYWLGGSRPNLEKVFEMTPDTFTTATKDAEGEAKTAADSIGKEVKALNGKAYAPEKKAVDAFDAEVNKQTLANDHEAVTAQKSAKETYDAKLLEKINEGKEEGKKLDKLPAESSKEYKDAKKALTDSEAFKALEKADADVKAAKAEALRNASKEEGKEALAKIVKDYDDAVAKAADKKAAKITELAGKDEMKSAFDKIKKMFPKEGKGKAAAIYGGIAAAVGLIAGYLLSGGKSAPVEQPAEEKPAQA